MMDRSGFSNRWQLFFWIATAGLSLISSAPGIAEEPVSPPSVELPSPTSTVVPGPPVATVSHPPTVTPQVVGYRQPVYLIRGGAGYWPGVNELADSLSQRGYQPVVIQHWAYAVAADDIADATAAGQMPGGIVLVGYSTGADTACIMARRLAKYGLRVRTMVLIESTLGVSVPENVDFCVNYYAHRRFDFVPVFRGVPVVQLGSATQLYNIDMSKSPQFSHFAFAHHLKICSCPNMRAQVGQVLASRQAPVVAASMYASVPATVPSAASLPSTQTEQPAAKSRATAASPIANAVQRRDTDSTLPTSTKVDATPASVSGPPPLAGVREETTGDGGNSGTEEIPIPQ